MDPVLLVVAENYDQYHFYLDKHAIPPQRATYIGNPYQLAGVDWTRRVLVIVNSGGGTRRKDWKLFDNIIERAKLAGAVILREWI